MQKSVKPRIFLSVLLLLCLLIGLGCSGGTGSGSGTDGVGEPAGGGSGGSGSGGGGSGGGGNGGGGSGSGGGGLSTPNLVTVGSGESVTGINITVASPTSNPTPNVEFLSVDNTDDPAEAFVTGGVTTQGETDGTVLLFGTGMSTSMQLSFTGPDDITISNLESVESTNGLSGLTFNISVASTAALGARILVLQDSNNDVTTFTGGVEVVAP